MRVWDKILKDCTIPDVITHINFGDVQLTDLRMTVGVKYCHSPQAFIVILTHYSASV